MLNECLNRILEKYYQHIDQGNEAHVLGCIVVSGARPSKLVGSCWWLMYLHVLWF